jgi:hypothetical protein
MDLTQPCTMLSVDHHGNSSVIPGSKELTGPWTSDDSDRPRTTATGPAEPGFSPMAMGAGRGEMSVVFFCCNPNRNLFVLQGAVD